MNSPTWLRPPKGVHWTPRLAATLTLIVIASALAFKGVVSLLFALLTFGGDIDPSAMLENSLKKHEQLAKIDRDRFDGRSAFFKPPEPVRNIPKPPPPPKVEKPLPPPEPVIPAEYGGKRPNSVLGSIVFFDNFQIKVGEQSNGIKVLATNAPWSVKLGHEGGEYDVPLWDKSKDGFLNGKWPTTRTPGIETSTAPIGKDKNLADGGSRGGPAGMSKSGPGNLPARPNSATPPSSPLGATPSNPKADNAASNPNASGLPGAPLPDATPLPIAPVQPVLPPNSQPPNQNLSASKNNGWESNQMAPPPPFTVEQIKGMTLAQAQDTQAAIQKAKSNPNLDSETTERLANELTQIAERINQFKGQSNPP